MQDAEPFLQRDELPNYRSQWIAEEVFIPRRQACTLLSGEDSDGGGLSSLENYGPLMTFTSPFHPLVTKEGRKNEFARATGLLTPTFNCCADGLYLLNTKYLVVSTSGIR